MSIEMTGLRPSQLPEAPSGGDIDYNQEDEDSRARRLGLNEGEEEDELVRREVPPGEGQEEEYRLPMPQPTRVPPP